LKQPNCLRRKNTSRIRTISQLMVPSFAHSIRIGSLPNIGRTSHIIQELDNVGRIARELQKFEESTWTRGRIRRRDADLSRTLLRFDSEYNSQCSQSYFTDSTLNKNVFPSRRSSVRVLARCPMYTVPLIGLSQMTYPFPSGFRPEPPSSFPGLPTLLDTSGIGLPTLT